VGRFGREAGCAKYLIVLCCVVLCCVAFLLASHSPRSSEVGGRLLFPFACGHVGPKSLFERQYVPQLPYHNHPSCACACARARTTSGGGHI
jgi:hypothetical protein